MTTKRQSVGQVLVCRTSWMERYQGPRGDSAHGGGEYVRTHGHGHESYNFKPFRGAYYGFCQSRGGGANLSRLGAPKGAQAQTGITVVWIARDPYAGGMYVVGWYEDATVYAEIQPSPTPARRLPNGRVCDFIIMARTAHLIDERDDRSFEVKGGVGGPGQANMWYPDAQRAKELLRYIDRSRVQGRTKKTAKPRKGAGRGAGPRMLDLERRLRIEQIAIRTAVAWYEAREFEVESVEQDHVGWDLEARQGRRKLLVEVKGTSLPIESWSVELTPNEFDKMRGLKTRGSYRIFIVANAEKQPASLVFSYSEEDQAWTAEQGTVVLHVEQRTSARVTPA